MIKLLAVLLFLPLLSFAQTKTVVKVPPSKDTTVITFTTTTQTTSNTSTGYTTATIPGVPTDTVVTPPVTPKKYEGFGSQAVGGSQVVLVSNKSQFDAAVSNPNGKIITFTSNASFTGRYEFHNKSYFTIDGNGFDITINNNNNGDGLSIADGCHHIVITGLRVINAGQDGINVVDGANNILIDHCSSYNNRDGNIDVAGDNSGITKNVTIQYCIIGDNQGSGRALVTAQSVSLHHNLLVSTSTSTTEGKERNPFIHANYSPVGNPNCDFRNNVIIGWGRYASGIGYKATGNFVNNYYGTNKGGAIDPNADPSGNTQDKNGIIGNHGNYFVSGNIQLGGANINLNGGNHAEYVIADPYRVTTTDARTAAADVKAKVGTAVKNAYEQGLINSIQ